MTPAGFEPFRGASTTTVARRGLASIVEASREVRACRVVPRGPVPFRGGKANSGASWQPRGNERSGEIRGQRSVFEQRWGGPSLTC